MDPRALVSERKLTALAVRHLTSDALGAISWEALGPTKALLKRWFSSQPWSTDDERALADLVGPGTGWWRHRLDEDLVLAFGWIDGRFTLEVAASENQHAEPSRDVSPVTLAGPVTPEATPNPRTMMFRTGPIHDGPSRPFRAGEQVDDVRVGGLFRRFPDIADVLVAADFVAVSLRRPGLWEALLAPIREAVAEEFQARAAPGGVAASSGRPDQAGPAHVARDRGEGRLERAWRELGSLRPEHSDDLQRILSAASDEDAARRQVAVNLLREADPVVAEREWSRLVHDASRSVRRATLDAMVDVSREELRPLLESALADDDAWARWKAVRGLKELGARPSRRVLEALTGDADFRVRQEAVAALRD